MSRISCPGCECTLRIDESKRGKKVRCPKCQHPFTVPPPPEEDDEEVEMLVVDRPKKPVSYGVQDEPEPPRPPPLPRRRRDEDEEDEEEDRPRPRRRGRKRRRRGSELPDMLSQWNLDKILLVGVVGVGLLLVGVALVIPPLVVGLFGVGILLTIAARIWALVAAFGEDSSTGCLTMMFPWYGFFNLEDRRPIFLLGVGILYILAGVAVVAILNATGRMG